MVQGAKSGVSHFVNISPTSFTPLARPLFFTQCCFPSLLKDVSLLFEYIMQFKLGSAIFVIHSYTISTVAAFLCTFFPSLASRRPTSKPRDRHRFSQISSQTNTHILLSLVFSLPAEMKPKITSLNSIPN